MREGEQTLQDDINLGQLCFRTLIVKHLFNFNFYFIYIYSGCLLVCLKGNIDEGKNTMFLFKFTNVPI